MIFSWIWTIMLAISFLAALLTGVSGLSAAAMAGAQKGVTAAISMAGALCLWSGFGKLMEQSGITGRLSKIVSPLLAKFFPDTKKDTVLCGNLCGNFCANLLGLGNAATPLGVAAAKGLAKGSTATDQLCRLVVLNTASIQLIPTTVAGVRASLGCAHPFDILPAVWITSLASALLGLGAAAICGKLWKD